MTLVIQTIEHAAARSAGVTLHMARADAIHPLASGNKFYKLSANLKYAKQQGYQQLLSFGGAFSNHIHALALSAEQHGLKSIGVIRGEANYAQNPTLKDAQAAGMQLHFVDRKSYQRRYNDDYLQQWQQRYPKALMIPEGGSNARAISGCQRLADEINTQQASDIITVACGTGATLAGIVCGLQAEQQAIGYAVLRDPSLPQRVDDFILAENHSTNRHQIQAADFGGYAKLDKDLLDFILDWLAQTGILLDPIYTSKLCRRLIQQIESQTFEAGTSIMIVHSGGLQGWRGMKSRVIALVGKRDWGFISAELVKN